MRRRSESKVNWREQIILFSVTVVAAVAAIAVGASDKWLTAIFCTVVVFGATLSSYRRRWHSERFWIVILGAFLIHLLLIWLIFAFALRQRNDVGELACLPAMLFECFLLYRVVNAFDGPASRKQNPPRRSPPPEKSGFR